MQYVDVSQARDMPGMRLVLTTGVPGPWGEFAKNIFYVKNLGYTAVAQLAGQPNEALRDWTGQTSAPVAVWCDEPPRCSWESIAWLAERLQPQPSLIPDDPAMASHVLGLARGIAGECGFGWYRRLMILHASMQQEALRKTSQQLGVKYGYSEAEALAAPGKVRALLVWFDRLLAAQEEAGSAYLAGQQLSLADLAWASFAIMVKPLPEASCPMPAGLRSAYTLDDPAILSAVTPRLLAHRDRIYQQYLQLPLDF